MSNSPSISERISKIIQNLSTTLGTSHPEWVETLSKKAHSKNITIGEWNALVSYAGLQAGDAELFKLALDETVSCIGERIDADLAVYGDTASAKEQAIAAMNTANAAAGEAQASEVAANTSAESALDYSLIAEGYALGTQNGAPVPFGSPYYGKDAKTSAAWAQKQAVRSETAATDASDSASAATATETRVNAAEERINEIESDLYNLQSEIVDTRNETSGYAAAAASSANNAALSANSAALSASNVEASKNAAQSWANSAAGSAGQASSNASTALGARIDALAAAKQAEGYAIGRQDGYDVGPTSQYYEKNAKYYAEEAARIVAAFGDGVDQTYDPLSANAQSGIAVAGAIAAIPRAVQNITSIDTVYPTVSDLPENAGNGSVYLVSGDRTLYSYDTGKDTWTARATLRPHTAYIVLTGEKSGIYRYTNAAPYLVSAEENAIGKANAYTDSKVGDINTALTAIIAAQNSIIGEVTTS
jgi:hypothetical protein